MPELPHQRRSSSLGSGFVIDASGIVITNNHVIADANEVTVILTDGQKLKAEVLGKDQKVDVAVLRVKPEKPLKAVKFGDSDKARVGDWVLAVGNPFGLGGSVTAGIVSARNRNIDSGPYDNYIQTDASINKGNSGGPLFNMDGEVIGINTAILSPSGGSVGIGFATPANTVQPVIEQLQKFGETRRGWLGVRIQNIDDAIAETLNLGATRGALVAGVDDKGPSKPARSEGRRRDRQIRRQADQGIARSAEARRGDPGRQGRRTRRRARRQGADQDRQARPPRGRREGRVEGRRRKGEVRKQRDGSSQSVLGLELSTSLR